MRTETGQVFRLEDYRPPEYGIDTVDLVFRLDAKRTLVSARLGMRRIAETPQGAPLVLDGDELEFISLSIDGAKAEAGAYTATAASLTLHPPPAAERFMLDIETAINPSANTKLMGLYRSNGVYCTQCEAEGFRRITYYLDRPDVLARWTVRIEADKATSPLLLSNGNPAGSGDLGDGRHYAVWVDPHPKPAYLFALVAGDLGRLDDSFVTESGRDVALTIFVEHGKEARATYAMDALKRSMRWDEERFGREYDLDVFAIV
nr:aminopeptidase N [Rhizobiaceae bacterium]